MKDFEQFSERDSGPMLFERIPSFRLVSDYLDFYASHQPSQEAVTLAGESSQRRTYGELREEVNRVKRALVAAGIKKGDRIAMLSAPRPEFLITFLAVTGVGAIWMGLNPRYRMSELERVVADAEPKIVFAFRFIEGRDYGDELESIAKFHSVHSVVVLDKPSKNTTPWSDFIQLEADESEVLEAAKRVESRDAALLVYTSGTTGKPKGALLSHHGLIFCSKVQASHFGHLRERTLNNLPINHVGCVGDITMATLVLGGTLVFMERFDPAALIEVLKAERITCWGQVPTMFHLTLAHPTWKTADTSALRYVVWSGAMMPRPLVEYFRTIGVKIGSAYGMTETVGSVTFGADSDSDEILSDTIGRPDARYDVRVAAPDGANLPQGEQGEVQVRGDFLLLQYLNNKDATSAAFTSDGWLKTGDAAILRSDGTIQLKGRLIEMYKSGGYNIYPREIEQVLESYAGVELACVIGVVDDIYGEVGRAFVIVSPDSSLTQADLSQYCKKNLANYKVPKTISIVGALPLLPIGKVDRIALRAMINLPDTPLSL
jgi:acyl-CoA synthetase (AMP-forming)/AMP-acid ligase II